MEKAMNCETCQRCDKVMSQTFWILIGKCWGNYAIFEGRASRKEFWSFVLVNMILTILLGRLNSCLALVFTLASFLPTVSVGVRRFHDIGKSGWAYLGFLVVFMVVSVLIAVSEWATKPITGLSTSLVDFWSFVGVGSLCVCLVAGLWFWALMLRRGVRGGNRFGTPPDRRGVCYLLFAGCVLFSTFSFADGMDFVSAGIPCAESAYCAIERSVTKGDFFAKGLKGPLSREVNVLNIPSDLNANELDRALVRGVYGYGRDRLAAGRTFTPISYARHLKMLHDVLMEQTKAGEWTFLKKCFTETNFSFCAWKRAESPENGRMRMFWCERDVCIDGSACCLFYVKSYYDDGSYKENDEFLRRDAILADWEGRIVMSQAKMSKRAGAAMGAIAQLVGSVEPVEVLSDVWIPVPAASYRSLDASNSLARAVFPMTHDKFLARTLLCCFPTNNANGGNPFESDIGLPAVRQIDDFRDKKFANGNKKSKRKRGDALADVVHRIDSIKSGIGRFGLFMDNDKWEELDRFWGDGVLRYSAVIRAHEGFSVVLSQRHFLVNERALYLSVRKDFPDGEKFDSRAIAQKQSELLMRWEGLIRETIRSKVPYSNDVEEVTTDMGVCGHGADAWHGGEAVEKTFGAGPTLSEQVKASNAATEWLRQVEARGRQVAENERMERKMKYKADKSSRVIHLCLVTGLVWLVVAVLRKFQAKEASRDELNSKGQSDGQLAKCMFCGGDVVPGRGIEIGLTKAQLGGCEFACVKVHCCDACYISIRQEGRKALLRWLSVSLMTFVVLLVIFSVVIEVKTLGVRIVLGGVLSFFPTLLILLLLPRLKRFAPQWHEKAANHPVIALLVENGFRLAFRVKHVTRGVPISEEQGA